MEKVDCRDSNDILSQSKAGYEEVLSKQLDPLFANPNGETWADVRKLLAHETESAVSKLLADISGLELDPKKSKKMVQDLKDYGRNVVERKARKEAGKVTQRMEVRFSSILSDAHIKGKNHKKTITKDACIECLKLLSVMVAIRIDEKPVNVNKVFAICKEKFDKHYEKTSSATKTEKHSKVEDKIMELSKDTMGKMQKMLISHGQEKQDKVIENMLISTLIDEKSSLKNTLASSTWPEIFPEDTLITPAECKLIWENFLAEILSPTQAFTSGQSAAKVGQRSFLATSAGVGATLGAAAL